jgi:hypothetical protein
MLVVKVNTSDFDTKVKAWLAAVEQAAEKAVVGMAFRALGYAARVTPQYSGMAAANWRLNIGSADTSYEKDPLQTKGDFKPHYHIGSNPAIAYAMNSQAGKLAGFKLGQTIYLSNSEVRFCDVKGDGNLFSGKMFISNRIEEGSVELRPVNRGSFNMARRAIAHLGHHYGNIGKSQLNALTKAAIV